MKRQQSEAELIRHLCEQVDFLRASGARFDGGVVAEAKRIATVARVLCHDTDASTSLLAQLGLLSSLRFCDTTLEEPDLPEPRETNGLQWIVLQSALAPIGPGGFGASLERATHRTPKPFADWWTAVVIHCPDGRTFARRNIVLSLANKDGGSHVDPELDDLYAALSRDGALGAIEYTAPDGTLRTDTNPIPGSMRQIAFELEQTLEPIVGRE